MYPRVSRNILSLSSQVKRQKTLTSASLIVPSLSLSILKIFPKILSSNVQQYCTIKETPYLPKDPAKIKEFIEDEAQKEINDLIKKNPELEKLKQIYELEIDVMRQDGERVPSKLRPRDWVELLKLKSLSARKKFLDYLFIIEKKNEKEHAEKLERRLEHERTKEDMHAKRDNGEIVYGIGQNSFLRRIVEPTMSVLWKWNCLKALMFGNKIVFDCSYEPYMRSQEIKSCAKQILESYSINRLHNLPFAIYLCNANLNGELIKRLHRYIPTLFDEDFPIIVSTKSYLEIFEKDQLVYLSSNAPQMLEKIDTDSVYIIGAYVDKGPKKPISLSKAKKENLRMAKLPLDKFVHFGFGSGKDLTLNAVTNILLDAQLGDWKEALKHVPTRKLYETRIHALERKVQNDYLKLKRDMQFDEDKKFNSEVERIYRKPKFQSNKIFNDNFIQSRFNSLEPTDYSDDASLQKFRQHFKK